MQIYCAVADCIYTRRDSVRRDVCEPMGSGYGGKVRLWLVELKAEVATFFGGQSGWVFERVADCKLNGRIS